MNMELSMTKPKRIRATELYCTGNLFRHKVQRDRTKYNRKTKHKGEAR
jgi:stalled ribosome alternative rescue factor ArfA